MVKHLREVDKEESCGPVVSTNPWHRERYIRWLHFRGGAWRREINKIAARYNPSGVENNEPQLRMGAPGLFFHVRFSTLLRGPNELPEGVVLEPISAPGAASESPWSENGDIDFSMVFAGSGAPRRVRCRPGMPPGSGLEVTSVSVSKRCRKSVPDGLRKRSQMGPKSVVKTSIWAPEASRTRNGRHRLHPHIYMLRSISEGGWTGLKGAHCSERFRRDASAPFFRDMQFTSIFTCSGAPRWAARAFMKAAETTSNYPLELSRGSRGCPEAAERLPDASEGPTGTLRTICCITFRDEGV